MTKRFDVLYITLGALYLLAGMIMGLVMGVRHDFTLAPVHAHFNLIGFVANSAFGLTHRAWPKLRDSSVAGAQFWIFVLGTPLYLLGLAMAVLYGHIGLVALGSIILIVGALIWFIMVWRNLFVSESA
ncbi:MAG TPA: hypothetical protein VGI20_13020 [Rhizomicrobium sp.]|jgi:hypothetical protein